MSSEVIEVEEIAPNTIGSLGVTHQPPVAEVVMVEELKVKEETDHLISASAVDMPAVPNSVGTSVTSTDADEQIVVVEVKDEKVSSNTTPQLAPASSDTERPVDRDEAALAIAALANTFSNHAPKPPTQPGAGIAASTPAPASVPSTTEVQTGVSRGTAVGNVSEKGIRSGSENRTASPVSETQSVQPNLSPSVASHAAGPLQQSLDAAQVNANMLPKQQGMATDNIYGAISGQGVVGGGQTSVSDLMMLAYAQQQQQQQQVHSGMVGMAGMGGMGDMGGIGWTPEETMAITRAQETLQQSAMQFAQATYAARIQAGSNELLAKEEARLVYQEYMQKGQQSLQLQLQTLYQQKMQAAAALQQQRALEAAMRLQQQQQQQASLAANRAGSLVNGAGMAGQGNVGLAGNSVSTMMSKLGAQAGGVVTGHQTTSSAAFSILCQAADERPDGSQVPPAQKNSPKHAIEIVERSFGSASTEKHSKEDQDSRIWRENLVGKTIEVEYDGEWYPAKVLMRNLDVFVVLYDEDDTEERMRLFPDFTAQDPEGDDDFRWRMKASSSAKKTASSASKTAAAAAAAASAKKKKNGEAETSESREDRKSQDGAASESSLKESIKEGREKRAELRALANARRLEEEALANAKKQEADAVSLRKKAEEEYRTKKEKLDDERREIEADRKKLEQERASVEKLHEEAVKLHKQNEAILKQIREEKQALAKLKKELQKSNSEEEDEAEVEEEEDKMDVAENAIEDDEEGEEEVPKTSKAGQRRRQHVEEDDRSSSAKGEDQDEEDDEDAQQDVDAEEEEGDEEEEETEEPTVKRMKSGRKPNGQKRTSTGSKRSTQSARRSSSGSQKLVSASENESHDEHDEHEEENEEESAQASEQDDHEEVSGGESTSSGKKRGRPSKKEPPSVMRWSTRKTVPVKRFEAGLKGKWASGRTPRALGYIGRGKFGFVPPTGVKALQFRVRVWWKDDKRFYEGTVDAFRNGKHKILYDDGDVEWLVLENETIEWFVPEGAEFAPLHIDPNLAFA